MIDIVGDNTNNDIKKSEFAFAHRAYTHSDFLVTPIAGYSNPEVMEELRALWKIKLYMDEVVKTKNLKREKSDIVQRRRK